MNSSFSRKVTQINPGPLKKGEQSQKTLLNDYLDCNYIILLGDPGSGKSHILRELAKHTGSNFLSVAQFIIKKPSNISKRVCIDGLDEKRVGSNSAIIDQIVEKLQDVDPEFCVISCRVADWRGSNDLETLNCFFDEKGGAIVLSLEALSEPEQKSILKMHNPEINVDEFVNRANTFNLDGMLKNPQTLFMLADSVSKGHWPDTKRALFENCCDFLLKEKNKSHADSEVGKYAPHELSDTAGYIFACLLFSDVQGLSLNTDLETSTHPHIRSLFQEHLDEGKLHAVVKRRIFAQDGEPHQVTYCHRTIAEFLAARWLSQQIDKGLPIARILAIMGYDGVPTSELRGVNAWLAVFQSNRFPDFIYKNPYGVMLYGDAASLSISSKRQLLQSLHKLSMENPLFRESIWIEPTFTGFINEEFVSELQEYLTKNDISFNFRSLILEALYYSKPLPSLFPIYQAMILNEDLTFYERHSAIELLAAEPMQNNHFITSGYHLLNCKSETDLLRLKAEILSQWYRYIFTWKDLIEYVHEEFNRPPSNSIGVHHALKTLPTEADCILILDNFPNFKELAGERWSAISRQNNIWCIDTLYKHWLVKALSSQIEISGAQVFKWLSKDHHLKNFNSWEFELKENVFINLVNKFQSELVGYFEAILYKDIPIDQWVKEICSFPRITYWTIAHKELLSLIISRIDFIPKARLHALYPIALQICEIIPEKSDEEFEFLYNLPDVKEDEGLISIRSKCLYKEIPEWRIKDSKGKLRYEEENQLHRKENIQRFEEYYEKIKSGQHLYLLEWLASLYLGNVSGTSEDHSLEPLEVFNNYFRDADYQFVLDGFMASITNTDLPSIKECAELATESRSYRIMNVPYVGFFEKWRRNQDFQTWTEQELRFAILLDLDCCYFKKHLNSKKQVRPEWFHAILEQFPKLVVSTYFTYFEIQLDHKADRINHLSRLTHTDALKPFRTEPLFKLLKRVLYTQVATDIVKTLIHDGCAKEELQQLTDEALANQPILRNEALYFWLMLGMVVSKEKLQVFLNPAIRRASFSEYVSDNFSDIITLLNNEKDDDKNVVYDTCITLVSNQYQYKVNNADSKKVNRRAAAPVDLVCSLINKISTTTTAQAISLLNTYSNSSQLSSYRDVIKKALSNQSELYRERTFQKPDWRGAISTLLNQQPSNYDDYFALILDYLDETIKKVGVSNANLYNLFWNTAKENRMKIPTPREENECRDALLALLEPILPSYISVQPEAAQVNENRTDIVFEYPEQGFRLPLEAKRQQHEDIWTAAESQLFAKYMKDVKLSGKGIYLIFWFGADVIKKMRKRDSTMKQKPQSANELKSKLEEHLPNNLKNKIAIRVLDVSRQ